MVKHTCGRFGKTDAGVLFAWRMPGGGMPMKAHVYAVFDGERWQAHLSVAPEADELYWTNPAFREGVLSGWGADADKPFVSSGQVAGKPFALAKSAEEGMILREAGQFSRVRLTISGKAAIPAGPVWLPEKLPLGIAVRTRQRLAASLGRCRSQAELHDELQRSWKWAVAQCGAMMPEETVAPDDGQDANPFTAMADLPPHRVRDIGRHLGQLARELAEKLRGRQLLEAEAAALAPERAGISLHVLLQVASLMGKVRLVSGVAPDGEEDDADASSRFGKLRGSFMASLFRRPRRYAWRCRRCGSRETRGARPDSSGGEAPVEHLQHAGGIRRTPCASCGRMRCAYCEMCLTMGRSRECGLLVIGEPSAARLVFPHPARHYLDGWGLSPPQREASGAALAYLMGGGQTGARGRRPSGFFRLLLGLFARPSRYERTFLLWAVTGAGKTEMLFPLLQAVLDAGGRAAVASPRRDVVLELAPRLAKAFPHASLAVLYGGSPHRLESANLTLATTHQLIRFRHAFDLVVIDEVDAYPYHNDPMLAYAAAGARAPCGVTVLLSATPPLPMQRAARRGRLPAARVPVRHHGWPLPVPQRLILPPLAQWMRRRAIPAPLKAALRRSAVRGAQIFVFVPYIRQVEPLAETFRAHAREIGLVPEAIGGTSSQDPERAGKVTAFRGRRLRLLVTTTILERGVTVPRSDVFVLDADQPLFDAAALVQMAGRAGRSADDPEGRVFFAAPAWTAPQREACRQIREMNREAKKKGYLMTCKARNG